MLVIRDSQIESFIANNDADLVKVVCDAVIKANQERVSTIRPMRLVSMVKLGIERAKAASVKSPEDIGVFVALMFGVSPTFDQQPEIASVLADKNYAMSERLSQLPERVTDEAWDEAVDSYDETFWFIEAN